MQARFYATTLPLCGAHGALTIRLEFPEARLSSGNFNLRRDLVHSQQTPRRLSRRPSSAVRQFFRDGLLWKERWLLRTPTRTNTSQAGSRTLDEMLAAARKLATSGEILLWMTPSEAPKALQASECSELLNPLRASCWSSAQH